MKLNKYEKQAITRAIVADIPKPDKAARRAAVQAAVVKAMSPECRKIYKTAPHALATEHVGDICYDEKNWSSRDIILGDCPSATLKEILTPYEAADEARYNTIRQLTLAVESCGTLAALQKMLPEFTKYFPAKDEPARHLPAVTNLVADLTKLGWPKTSRSLHMPDLQTALSKVIDEWEKPMQPTTPEPSAEATAPAFFKVTNNVTRATFDFVKQNPGLTRAVIVAQLTKRGFKETSTTTLLTQMLRQGMFKQMDGRVFATQTEYTPIKASIVRPRKPPEARSPRKSRGAKTAELTTPATSQTMAPPQSKPTVDSLLQSLSISEARKLYDELHKIFNTKN